MNIKIPVLIMSMICVSTNGQEKIRGAISLSGAFALYPLTVMWAEEFRKSNPDIRIDISAGGAGKGITDALTGMVDIGMVSRAVYPEELNNGAYPIAVAKDAVVPVINADNPAIEVIMKSGIKQETAKNIWVTGLYKKWSQAFGSDGSLPIRIYTRSDACGAAETWAHYLGIKQEDLLGSGVYGDPGLALAVKKDKLGIGYNNIGYVYDLTTKKQLPGLRVIPLDLNGDGKISMDENVYDSLDKLTKAMENEDFPSPPVRELYFVTKGKPEREVVRRFLLWVLTEGQKHVNEAGYVILSAKSIMEEQKKVQ